MNSPQDFVAWALDPQRTLEEAFFAEIVVELGVEKWEQKRNIYRRTDWDVRHERGRGRRLNPAHRARLKREDVEKTAEILPEFTYFSYYCYDYDRPIRDLSGLRFLTALNQCHFGNSQIPDLSPLAGVPNLAELHLHDEVAEDFRPLARCPKLKKINLWINQPWPNIEGLENLPALEDLWFTGNLLVLETVPRLSLVHTAHLGSQFSSHTPLRDVRRLPEMPRLRTLVLEGVHRLEGIERYPHLRVLTLCGMFRDLTPLAALHELTHLTLKGNMTRDLTPLTRLPALRKLTVEGDHPQDYLVLADTPLLHEVEAKGCDINQTDLSALHALLSPWSAEFANTEPHPLPPLRFRVLPHEDYLKFDDDEEDADARHGGDNYEMQQSERVWLARCLQHRITKVLEDPHWGDVNDCPWVNIHSLEAAERLPEIVRIVRAFLATTRHRFRVHLRVELKAEWHRDPDKDPELSDAVHRQRLIEEEVEEQLEWERQRRENRDYLARLQELQQLQQEGAEIKPEQFAPPPETEEPEEEADQDGQHLDGSTAPEPDEVDEGTLWDDESEPHPLAGRLNCWLLVTESQLRASHRDREAAVYFMRRPPDEG
jgi:hypothetical protein